MGKPNEPVDKPSGGNAMLAAKSALNKTMFAECSGTTAKAALPIIKSALNDLIIEHGTLRTKYNIMRNELDAALSIIRNEYVGDNTTQQQRNTIVQEMLGEGYDMSGKTFRRHRMQVMLAIRSIAGPEHLKQHQLAESLYKRYTVDPDIIHNEAREAVLDGIREVLHHLRVRNTGRYPTMDRVTQEVLLTAAMAKASNHSVATIASLLNTSVRSAHTARGRVNEMTDGTELNYTVAYEPEEKSVGEYPPDWSIAVQQMWADACRASECKSDEARNPFATPGTKLHETHRIHWIETRLSDMHASFVTLGKSQFGDVFHLGTTKMRQLKPYFCKVPGRNVCLCRYHMAFDNFHTALCRWKQTTAQRLPSDARDSVKKCPTTTPGLRALLCCTRDEGSALYKPTCCDRSCASCKTNLSSFFSGAELETGPSTIKYMKWMTVTYVTKDGRELSNGDFREAEVPIADFIAEFDLSLQTFLPHHNRAKYQDAEWKRLWENVSAVPNRVCCVMDYANSYAHEHKDEHMQEFWSTSSTTIFGCVMKIAIANLNDTFLPADERAALIFMLDEQKLPHEVIIMHALLTPNPHHDTAGVQFFFEKRLFPWLWENTTGLQDGGLFYVRSDGCGGQFKSGRHFRFIANFAQYAWARGVRLLWSHFESAHGKDLSDPECGRMKFILRCHEMRHTPMNPTMLKTSFEAYTHLSTHHCKTTRSIFEKKGKGIHSRVYYFAEYKEIPALARLAAVKTLAGACTSRSHMFNDCREPGMIEIRDLACLTCPRCVKLDFRACPNTELCGVVDYKVVELESGSTAAAPVTRDAVRQEGRKRAHDVTVSCAIL